jgi:homopolymeric O-antigen transport system permease protein
VPVGGATTQTVWSREDWWLLRRTLINLRTGFEWAWLDIVCQYRRSRIGPLWETINVAVMMLGLAYISAAIFGGSAGNLVGYIGLGIIIWTAITSLITDGCTTFTGRSQLILSSNISIDLYVQRTVFKVFLTLAHHSLLYFIGLALGIVPLTLVALLAIPGLAILFLNGFWVVTLLAFICARFRDVELIVRNLLQLVFFVTPIFWNYQLIASNRTFLVEFNPFFHFIEIIRAPLLGHVPPLNTYLMVAAVTVIGYAVAYLTYRRMRRQIAFFV